MKLIILLVTATLVFSAGLSTPSAQEAGKEKDKEAVESRPAAKKADTEAKSGIQDWLASFWSRVSKVGKKRPSNVPTSVAGLRGAEQEKGKELTPYWKGKEKNKDGSAMVKAESLINKKDFAGAIDELQSFEQSYPDSPLKPIAVLSLAYCYARTGKSEEARSTFEGFLKDYPDHELAADAKAGIELLKKKNN